MSSGWRIATVAPERAVRVWLGLGSNLGDRRRHLSAALERIRELGRIEAVSPVYETEPVGPIAQPDFWNLVVRLVTRLRPEALLEAAKTIEVGLGRKEGEHWGPRPIDIDILLYGRESVHAGGLEIPHPRMLERGFVLRPVVDIDPGLVHPVSGQKLEDVLHAGAFERIRRLFPGSELLESG